MSKSKCWQLIPTTDKLEYDAGNRARTVGGCCPLLPTLKVQKKGLKTPDPVLKEYFYWHVSLRVLLGYSILTVESHHSGKWELVVKQMRIQLRLHVMIKTQEGGGWKMLGVRNKVYCVFPGPVISCGCPASHWNSSLRKWTTGNSIHSPLRASVSAVGAAVAAGDAAAEQKAWESCVGLSW